MLKLSPECDLSAIALGYACQRLEQETGERPLGLIVSKDYGEPVDAIIAEATENVPRGPNDMLRSDALIKTVCAMPHFPSYLWMVYNRSDVIVSGIDF